MSGDVQPRKRNKDNKKKKKESHSSDVLHLHTKPLKRDDDLEFDDTNIHVQKDIKFGGNVCAKVFFSLVFGALFCMVGLILLEHRGSGNEVQSGIESPWSQMFEGWLEDHKDDHHEAHHHAASHDEHDEEEHEDDHSVEEEVDEHDDASGEHDDASGEHDDEEGEGDAIDQHEDNNTERENDEQGIFTGFVKKYLYNTDREEVDAETDTPEPEDEGYDSQEDDDEEDIKHNETDDIEEEEEEEEETKENSRNVYNRKYDDKHDDEDLEEDEEDDRIVDDWRKIVYRSPSPPEDFDSEFNEEDDKQDEANEDEKSDEDDLEDQDDSSENTLKRSVDDDEQSNEDDQEDNLEEEVDGAEEVEGKHEEDVDEKSEQQDEEGAGIAIKFGVGVALIVVAHVVLVKKWKDNVLNTTVMDTAVPQAPLPPSSPSPVYVEEISPEEEEIPIPLDRRATLVEPGEVVLPSSDVDESDLGEYEEEVEEEEEEVLSQMSDVEPTQESTIVTYEYSPVDSEQEEEEVSESSVPINDKWATLNRPLDSNSEGEEMLEETGSEVEYSDNEPTTPVPAVQTKFGGPKSAEEYIFEDITNDQDWEIKDQLDTAEAQYNQSEDLF